MARRDTGEQGITDEAVENKTGKRWEEWFRLLDRWGAKEKAHREIARHLQRELNLPGWWAQTVTVRYEQQRGRREVGQTIGGWQVSTQRTLRMGPEAAWKLLTQPSTRKEWLGPTRLQLREGTRYRLADGTEGEVRAVRPHALLRMTWEPAGGRRSTLDISLSATGRDKTAVRFMHQGIGTKTERETLKKRWQAAVTFLAARDRQRRAR